MKNFFCKGVRTASEFLMSLQLGGAFQKSSLFNIQIRMPIVIVGAGLTAIDVATEVLSYYIVQVEKFSVFYNDVIKNIDCNFYRNLNVEDKQIADEFLEHAYCLSKSSNFQDKVAYLRFLGGVKILCRSKLEDSQAFKINQEELLIAFREGIEVIDLTSLSNIEKDDFGHISNVFVKSIDRYGIIKDISFPAKTLIFAIGTHYNDDFIYENRTSLIKRISSNEVSFLGDFNKDNKQDYSGSVVKAISSAKYQYMNIVENIKCKEDSNTMVVNNIINNIDLDLSVDSEFLNRIEDLLSSKILSLKKIAKNVLEIHILSPLLSKNFQPGQFFKLQNFSHNAQVVEGLKLEIEPIALTGSFIDRDKGVLSLIVLDSGVSSYLCNFLKVGENISLMGPTGKATEICKYENVLLIGGGLGNAVFLSIGHEMKKNMCNITYCAGYKNIDVVFKKEEIESFANKILWCCESSKIEDIREVDVSYIGNIIDGLSNYIENNEGEDIIPFDRIIISGSSGLMHAFQKFYFSISILKKKNELRDSKYRQFFKDNCKIFASINSPMQCMMKGVCGACIQRVVDFNTNKESFIFSCMNQDQNLNNIDFDNLDERLKQNSLFEKLSYVWVKNTVSQKS